MPRFDVAHVQEQGVDLIIIPLDSSFGLKTQEEQNAARTEFQIQAGSAGLAGTVVLMWDTGGCMGFLAPPNFAPFFQSINLDWVAANLNRQICW